MLHPWTTAYPITLVQFSGHNLQNVEAYNLIGFLNFHVYAFSCTGFQLEKKSHNEKLNTISFLEWVNGNICLKVIK